MPDISITKFFSIFLLRIVVTSMFPHLLSQSKNEVQDKLYLQKRQKFPEI